jgi:hypothetical protein
MGIFVEGEDPLDPHPLGRLPDPNLQPPDNALPAQSPPYGDIMGAIVSDINESQSGANVANRQNTF